MHSTDSVICFYLSTWNKLNNNNNNNNNNNKKVGKINFPGR